MPFAEVTVGMLVKFVAVIDAFATFNDEGSATSKDPSKEATTALESKEVPVFNNDFALTLIFNTNVAMIKKIHSAVSADDFCHTFISAS
jgi:hypothetical protein